LLQVCDDGQGFKLRPNQEADHFGLPGMQERAQLAGGELTIDSQPGRGTTVQLSIKDVE
jgi:signal transduction histidine kinase